VNTYKSINFHIDKLLIDLRQLHFIDINDLTEYDPEAFCKAQYVQMNLQVKCVMTSVDNNCVLICFGQLKAPKMLT
jgi:hypothetical protein